MTDRDDPFLLPQDLGIGRLFEAVRDAVVVADARTGRIVLWNPAASRIFGYSRAEALGLLVEALIPQHLRDRHRAGLARYRETGTGRYVDSDEPLELPALRKGGEEIRVELSLSAIGPADHEPDGGHYALAIIRDVTERKRMEERLAYLAYHDGLTGLANRAIFLERLEGAIARADRERSRVAVLYLDLDRFKEVNDSLGHDAGDELLKAVAERLQRSVRFGARSVSRLGGDEFCAMLEGVADAEEAENVASRVAEQLVGPYSVGGHEMPGVAASVGVAVRPPGAGTSAGQLLREADLAMYQTKRHAR
ncbi:MAG TPA: diguanylate cyclase [Rubrobacter sp.]|nr:diguanylate cyclase [Rubrobacter sp.]